jgi:hypothetical protein
MECSFRLQHYQNVLLNYKSFGYNFDFKKTDSPMNILLLHDIDMRPQLALKMAKAEVEIDCTSIYFFRHASPLYNLFAHDTLSIINDLSAMGHITALHLEVPPLMTGVNTYLDDLRDFVFRAKIFNSPYFNIHEPSRTGLKYRVDDINNFAYYSKRLSFYKYISDSSGRWREGCFCSFVGKANNLAVLTHPVWWFHDFPNESY